MLVRAGCVSAALAGGGVLCSALFVPQRKKAKGVKNLSVAPAQILRKEIRSTEKNRSTKNSSLKTKERWSGFLLVH